MKRIIALFMLMITLTSCGKAKPVENSIKSVKDVKNDKEFYDNAKINYEDLYNNLPDVNLPEYDFKYLNSDENAYKKIVFANYDKLLIYDGKALILFRNKKFYRSFDAEKFNLKYFQGNKSTKFVFSPYGNFAVAGNTMAYDDVYLINVNTGESLRIYSGDIDKININWSPLEKYLAFTDEDIPSKVYVVNLLDGVELVKNLSFDSYSVCIDDLGNVLYDGNGVFREDLKISSGSLICTDYDNLYTYDGKTFSIRDISTGKSKNNYDVGFKISKCIYKDDNVLIKDADNLHNIIYNIYEKKFYKVNSDVVNIAKDIFGKKTYYFIKKDGTNDIFIVDEKTGKSKKTLYAFSPIVDINTYLGFSIGYEVDQSIVRIGVNDNNSNVTIQLIN
ncbi:hypothetical protein [Thermoanaerobacterium thermosaccharolyticum]|uniref:hypothetical protein n=1 Tax=Thermoanaerobacterium thermosaccharolyticum TaxID=1517 RepID=UPI003D2ADF7A